MKVVVAVLLLLTLPLVGLWLGQRRFVYFPDRSPLPRAGDVLPGARDVTLRTSDGIELRAWLVPPAAPTGPGRGYSVLVANGNGGNRAHRVPLAAALASEGFAVMLFDYRGYGENAGEPSEAGLARDVRAAYAHLVDGEGVPGERVVFFGESIGAAVVTELATEHPPAALVLRSPFVDLVSVGRTHYPFLPLRLLLRDRYPVASRVAETRVPTAVVYGTADSIVPPEQSRTVAAEAAGPVAVTAVEGADHNDPELVNGPRVIAAVVQLVTQS